jgi:HSP20 family protein
MAVKRYNPFDFFERMSEAFNRDLSDWFYLPDIMTENTLGVYEGDWSPKLDLFDDKEAYYVKVDVPGIDSDDIEISVTNDVLTIKGKKKEVKKEGEPAKKGGEHARKERRFGSFHRTVPLPLPVDAEHVDAKLKDGVLYITLPKREETKPKKISVSVS